VIVVDARPRLGGRATAFRDRHTGEFVDNGQHVMFGCYRETMAFLHRIGAAGNVRVQDALQIPFLDASGRRSVLSCPRLPAPWHLLAGVLRWDALPLRDRLSAIHLARPLKNISAGTDATSTVAEWLRAHRQSEQLIAWLWEPLAVAALNQPVTEAAAGAFIRVLSDLFAPDRRASALVLPLTPLDQMYAEPARAFIESHGGEVRMNALARVTTDGTCVTGVQLREERIRARTVISTVPWHLLRTLFEDVPPPLADIAGNAARMHSKPLVTVNLWYDRVVMEDPFVGLHGRAMQWIFDKRRAFGETASHLSLVSSAASALVALDSEQLIALAAREVAGSLPGARAATLVRATVVREKHATFSLSPGEPPRPATATPLKGFYLAGDWTDTGLPGTIESAVVSGQRAARAVLSDQFSVTSSIDD
jgi:squalene-associated FAD-dependent desaturase